VKSSVALSFPIREVSSGEGEVFAWALGAVGAVLREWAAVPPTTGPYRQIPCSTGITARSILARTEPSSVLRSPGRSRMVPGLLVPGPAAQTCLRCLAMLSSL
jgi:hypothetical protein